MSWYRRLYIYLNISEYQKYQNRLLSTTVTLLFINKNKIVQATLKWIVLAMSSLKIAKLSESYLKIQHCCSLCFDYLKKR